MYAGQYNEQRHNSSRTVNTISVVPRLVLPVYAGILT
jgi:hypothetical protein